jgi:tetratricopeptide (TPR) repeat protein
VAYANLKQYDEARQYAQEALSLNPDFASELEAFLKQLPQ